jgi:hypothetical protein
MNFSPLTEEQIVAESIAPEGTYPYWVTKSEEKISSTGNEYISLKLEISGPDGRNWNVFTGLFFHKLIKHFCDVNGLQNEYNSGTLSAASCLNKDGGRVLIGVEPEKDNGKGGKWPAKNIVKDYVQAPPGSLTRPLPIDDDVPF